MAPASTIISYPNPIKNPALKALKGGVLYCLTISANIAISLFRKSGSPLSQVHPNRFFLKALVYKAKTDGGTGFQAESLVGTA